MKKYPAFYLKAGRLWGYGAMHWPMIYDKEIGIRFAQAIRYTQSVSKSQATHQAIK